MNACINRGLWVKFLWCEQKGWWHRALVFNCPFTFPGLYSPCFSMVPNCSEWSVTILVIYLCWKFKLIREFPYHHPITRKLSDSLGRNSTGSVKLGLPFCSGPGSLQQLWLRQQEHLLQMSGMHCAIKRKSYNLTATHLSPVWSWIQ